MEIFEILAHEIVIFIQNLQGTDRSLRMIYLI